MKKHWFDIVFMTNLLVCFSACRGKNILTPTSTGLAYEILVVVDHELWEQPAGRTLFDVLNSDISGLFQSERSFHIIHAVPENYNALLKRVRNVIVIDIDKVRNNETKFNIAKDVYAASQVILTIQAPDDISFAEFVKRNAPVIKNYFIQVEMNRQIKYLEYHHSDLVWHKVKKSSIVRYGYLKN